MDKKEKKYKHPPGGKTITIYRASTQAVDDLMAYKHSLEAKGVKVHHGLVFDAVMVAWRGLPPETKRDALVQAMIKGL